MYCKTLNLHIFPIVTPVEAVFLSLSPEFAGLHNGIKIFLPWFSYHGLQSEHEPTIVMAQVPGVIDIAMMTTVLLTFLVLLVAVFCRLHLLMRKYLLY